MPRPCDSELTQAPFQTYRDPQTGEWRLKNRQDSTGNVGKIIPFRRTAKSLAQINRTTDSKNEIL